MENICNYLAFEVSGKMAYYVVFDYKYNVLLAKSENLERTKRFSLLSILREYDIKNAILIENSSFRNINTNIRDYLLYLLTANSNFFVLTHLDVARRKYQINEYTNAHNIDRKFTISKRISDKMDMFFYSLLPDYSSKIKSARIRLRDLYRYVAMGMLYIHMSDNDYDGYKVKTIVRSLDHPITKYIENEDDEEDDEDEDVEDENEDTYEILFNNVKKSNAFYQSLLTSISNKIFVHQ